MAGGSTVQETVALQLKFIGDKFKRGIGMATKGIKTASTGMSEFHKTMKHPRKDLKNAGKNFKTVGGRAQNFAKRIRMATHGMRGFRMEMLGVMFFGKMLQKTFTGLLRPIMDTFGVFDLFKTMLKIVFLPIMKTLFPFFLKLFKIVTAWSPKMKKMVGWFVVLGAILGTVLFLVGSFALGIGSLILALGWLVTPLGLVVAGFLTLIGIKGISEWIKNIGSASDKAGEKVVEMGFISAESFGLIKDKVVSAFATIKGVFAGMKSKIGDWVAEHAVGALDTVKAAFTGLKSKITSWFTEYAPVMITNGGKLITNIATGLLENASKIGTAIGNVIGTITEWITEHGAEVIAFGLDILTKLVQGLEDNADNISIALEAIMESIGIWIKDNAGKLAALGAQFFAAMFSGAVKAFSESETIQSVALPNVPVIGNVLEDKTGLGTRELLRIGYLALGGGRSDNSGRWQANFTTNFNGFTMEQFEIANEENQRLVEEEINRVANQ